MDVDIETPVDEMRAEMEAEMFETFNERGEDPEEYPEEFEGAEERFEEADDDGQPSEQQEWQDLPYGGDEGPADYDQFEGGFGLDGMGPDSE